MRFAAIYFDVPLAKTKTFIGAVFLKILSSKDQSLRSPDKQILAKIQFWSYHSILMCQVIGFVN